MKLLGWMHQKLRQQSKEPLMNFTGNPSTCYSAKKSIDKQLYDAEPTYSFAQLRQPNRKCQKLSNKMKETGIEEVLQEESCEELFHGFLAIGTLGSEPLNTDPPTPVLPKPFQNITDKEIEITENELKLINNELEKFLGAEAKEVADESSARSSQVSIITFSDKQLDGAYSENWGYSANCPLQKYLFGNSVTAEEPNKEKMSLQELFSINDCSCENYTKKYDCPHKPRKQRYASHFMKKILKKLHSTAMSCTTASSEKVTKSEAIKRKLPKVLKIFHRKVHPEGLIAEKQFIKAKKDEIEKASGKSNIPYAENGEKKSSPKMANLKKEIFNPVPYSERINSDGMTVNREHWIKTDDDYLVLEL